MWNQLAQQLQSLRPQIRKLVVHACYIATWPVEADDEASLNRVNASAENDWNCCGGGFGRKRCLIAAGSGYYSYAPTNQIGGQLRQLIQCIVRPSVLDDNVLTFKITDLSQNLCGRRLGGVG